jgi:hypothetical protein
MVRSVKAALVGGASVLAGGCGLPLAGAGSAMDEPPAEGGTYDSSRPEADIDAADGAAPAADAGSSTDSGTEAGNADATADEGSTGAPTVITVVQTSQTDSPDPTTSLSIPLSPTQSGDFVAVLATYAGPTLTIAGITDDAPGGSSTYQSANIRSSAPACQATEIWYARNVQAGATSVSVAMSAGASMYVWVLEASGLGASGGVDIDTTGSGATTTITVPPVSPTGVPALLLAAVGSCGSAGNLVPGNPFVALPIQQGNTAAYYIATSMGSWGPVFDNTDSAWNASIAAFR